MADRIATKRLVLRPLTERDFEPVVAMLAEPGVTPWWPRFDSSRVRKELFAPPEKVTVWGIEFESQAIGVIATDEESHPDYPSAGIDIFIGEAWWGQGFGTEAINAVCENLVNERGHHRITIDPALANTRAIRCYERAGFRTVGLMELYERGPDGAFRDSLLMEWVSNPKNNWRADRD